MRVLILSVSAKVPLIKAFKTALQQAGGRLFGSDLDPHSPALSFCDETAHFPASDDPVFPRVLQSYCPDNAIDLVIPTRDGELLALSDMAQELRDMGTEVAVAPREALEVVLDKRKFVRFCADAGFPCPIEVDAASGDTAFQIVGRPLKGSGSAGLISLRNVSEIGALQSDYLFQERIEAPEFSVDTLMDFEGLPIQAVARERLAIKGGEAVKSKTAARPDLETLALTICKEIGLVAHNVVQLFDHPERGPLLIEINARFGGASSLSIESGLASPERLLALIAGRERDARRKREIFYDLLMTRYPSDLYIHV